MLTVFQKRVVFGVVLGGSVDSLDRRRKGPVVGLRGQEGLVDFALNWTVLQLVYSIYHYLSNLLLFLQFPEVVLLTILLN